MNMLKRKNPFVAQEQKAEVNDESIQIDASEQYIQMPGPITTPSVQQNEDSAYQHHQQQYSLLHQQLSHDLDKPRVWTGSFKQPPEASVKVSDFTDELLLNKIDHSDDDNINSNKLRFYPDAVEKQTRNLDSNRFGRKGEETEFDVLDDSIDNNSLDSQHNQNSISVNLAAKGVGNAK